VAPRDDEDMRRLQRDFANLNPNTQQEKREKG
jgi:hypothetical protein